MDYIVDILYEDLARREWVELGILCTWWIVLGGGKQGHESGLIA